MIGFELTENNHVPISSLVSQRKGLANVCSILYKDYRIVYNGKGGYDKEPAAFGLRERINQEINCADSRTGTLNIQNRFHFNKEQTNLENWGVSYFDFDQESHKDILKGISYKEHSGILETLWRLEYGTPILSRY